MKKVVRLTESDLVKIVKRVVKEESSPKEKGKDLYTLLHSLRNSINDEDKKEALSKLEDVLSIVRDMDDKTKSKRKVNENRHEEKDIFISKGFKGVRDEVGETASPSDIIELYNEYVEEGTPLVKYLGRDIFMNANDEEVDKYTVLDELNYALVGEEDYDEDDMGDLPKQKRFGDGNENEIYLTDNVRFHRKGDKLTLSYTPTKTMGGLTISDKQKKMLIDFLSK
jgi:hypothetical protein